MPIIRYKSFKNKQFKKRKDKTHQKFSSILNNEPSVVSVLFGNFEESSKLRSETLQFISQDWVKKTVKFFVLGSLIYDFLKEHDIAHVYLVNQRSSIAPGKEALYNKAFLLDQAMSDIKEMLYIDVDTVAIRPPDDNLWSILRSKKGDFGGSIQMVPVYYGKSEACFWRKGDGRDTHYCLNSCTLYCKDRYWTRECLKSYADKEYGDLFINKYNDEFVMTYAIDKHIKKSNLNFGYMIDNFGTDVTVTYCSRWIGDMDWKHLYFTHHIRPRKVKALANLLCQP